MAITRYENKLRQELAAHQARWQLCNRCPIGKHCSIRVFYRGSVPCKYLFIGEAPGPSECVTKEPFTGPAGKILNQLLADTKLTQFGITNTIACFPSREDDLSKFRVPEEFEIENCRERLDELIEIVSPQFYISLGKTASNNPPSGIEFHLQLDHPSFILRKGGVGSNEYKRNRHRLSKFLKETNEVDN